MQAAVQDIKDFKHKQLSSKLWMPKQVLITPAAMEEPWGMQIYERVKRLGLPVHELKHNRITGLRGAD